MTFEDLCTVTLASLGCAGDRRLARWRRRSTTPAPPTRRSRSATSARTRARPRPTARSARPIGAYFDKVNAEGGINGRKIKFITSTTATTRPRPSSRRASWSKRTRCCCVFNPLGTPSNTAIHKYMNTKKVPQLFVATGATKWGDPKNFPWTMGWQPNYQTEAQDLRPAHPRDQARTPRSRMLYQNDDYGKDYLKGFEDGLGDKAKTMIVSKISYEVTDPTDRQPDGVAEGLRRRHLLQHHHAEVRGAGDQEGGRDRLEADALPEQRVGLGRLGDDAGRRSRTAWASSPPATSRTRPTRSSRRARNGTTGWPG